MGKKILFYGFISGLALIIMFMMFFAAIENVCESYGIIPMWGYGLATMAFLISVPAAYKYAKRSRKSNFGRAFGVAMAICVVAGLVFSVYSYIQFATPEVEDEVIYTGCEMLTINYQNVGKEALGLEIVRFASFNMSFGKPLAQTAVLFLTFMVIGLIVSLLAASVAAGINSYSHKAQNK